MKPTRMRIPTRIPAIVKKKVEMTLMMTLMRNLMTAGKDEAFRPSTPT